MKLLLILLTCICAYNLYAQETWQWNDSTSIIIFTFDESMSIDGLLDKENYSVVGEDENELEIYKIGIVALQDTISYPDSSVIAVITERADYNITYTVEVNNVKDRAGNEIQGKNTAIFYFNGFSPNKIQTPSVNFRK